jgi:hypothetical protein
MINSRCLNRIFAGVFLVGAISSSAGTLIDVAFTGAAVSSKTGFAAIGVTTNDFWNSFTNNFRNTYPAYFGALPNLEFVDGTASGAGLTVANIDGWYGDDAYDPMYATYWYVNSGVMTVTVTNLGAGVYDFFFYGHGNFPYENSVFYLSIDSQSYGSGATTNGDNWNSPVWQEGVQYVEFTNVPVEAGEAVTAEVVPGSSNFGEICGLQIWYVSPPSLNPQIMNQPVDQDVPAGTTAIFSVDTIGAPPFGYQWLFNGTDISAATNSGYSVTNAQPANAGNYSVIVTNAYGSVTSAVAALSVIIHPVIVSQPTDQTVLSGATATFGVVAVGSSPFTYQWLFNNANIFAATNSGYSVTNAQPTNAGYYSVIVANSYGSITSIAAVLTVNGPFTTLIDVAFTYASVTGKAGIAAIGLTTNDFWNTYLVNSESLPNLRFVDGTISGAGLAVASVGGGAYSDTASDPMYAFYLYNQGNITVTVTNIAPGVYDFFLYGHGNHDDQNSIFQLTGAVQNFSSEATSTNSDWLSPLWQEGVQYVEFTNVIVSPGLPITITVEHGASQYAVLAGLQMATVNPPANSAPIILNTPSQSVIVPQAVTVTNYAFSGNGPISFTLASNAPTGASITRDGVFGWAPTCEQGSSTNLITVWATDSSSPPLSNSMTFSVIVGDCVEISIGSSVTQAGQGACVPVSLLTSVGLTNLTFILATPSGFLTNWSVSSTNSSIASATVQEVASQPQFIFEVQSGQVLQGASVIGSICMDALSGAASAFVPLVVANPDAVASNNSPATNSISQAGRVVLIGPQSLLEALPGTNPGPTLTLYGHPGASYHVLSTTSLAGGGSWSNWATVTLSDISQVISLGSATNQMQFFRAVNP